MNKNLRQFAVSGIKWSTVGTIGLAIFQLLQISILTRFLPKETFGLVAMALFVVNFTNIFVDMGFTSAILHHKNASNNEYNSVYWFNILIAIFFYVVILILTPYISVFYKELELNKIIPIISFNLIILALGRTHRTIMEKEFRFKQISITDLFSFFCGLVAAIFFAVNNYGIYSLIYSTLIASLISSVLFVINNARLNAIKMHFQFGEVKPFFKVGSYAMGSQFISFFSTDIDILIIGKILGPGELGLYSLAKQIVMKLYAMVNPIITKVLTPLLSKIQDDKMSLKSYFLKSTSILSSINIPLYLLIFVLSKEILIILYGKEYVSANLILGYLSLAYCTYSICNPVGSLQIATGRTDIGLKYAIFSLIVTPIVIYFSAHININAVAYSRAILSIILIIPLWWIQLRPMANIQLKEYLEQFLKPYLLLLFVSGAYFVTSSLYEPPFNMIFNAILKGITGIMAYSILLWIIDKKRIIELLDILIKSLNLRNNN